MGNSHVLIFQADPRATQILAEFFEQRKDLVFLAATLTEAQGHLKHNPDLIIIDSHLPDDQWLSFLREVRREYPKLTVLMTSDYPDSERELKAKEHGAEVFLRKPFIKSRIEAAIKRLHPDVSEHPVIDLDLPKVRIPVRIKLTLPYVVLALAFAIAAAALVNRYVLESVQNRFATQLAEAGRLTSDSVVDEERRLLETLRLIANTQGVDAAITQGDADQLRTIVLPIAVNSQEEVLEVLDSTGIAVLSLRRQSGSTTNFDFTSGNAQLKQLEFVQNVLTGKTDEQGDKFSGLVRLPEGDFFYVAGPVRNADNKLVGVALVGESVHTLAQRLRQATLAQITFYTSEGEPLVSTFDQSPTALSPAQVQTTQAGQDTESPVRDLSITGQYTEIVGPWEVRGGADVGILGTALARGVLVNPTQVTQIQAFAAIAAAFVLVIAVGVYLAGQITHLLLQVVRASSEVAQGNLEVKVTGGGDDEVAVLAKQFNFMVTRLQEGSVYRDLLGRTVSPQVRDQLRRSFESGGLKLEGQTTEATVMMTDIRGFTTISEKREPTTIFTWLNEYFGELVPVITTHGGVVDKFEGDAILAFFGVLPEPLSPQESAFQACRAAQEMLDVIEQINAQRIKRGDPPFITGIGINTGHVTAGGLGASDRLNYTIIGDAVNTTQRLESFTRQLGATSIVMGEATYQALGDKVQELPIESLGAFSLKGKSESVAIYRLRSASGN